MVSRNLKNVAFNENDVMGWQDVFKCISAPLTELMIRFTILLLSVMLLITALCIASKVMYTFNMMYLRSDLISDRSCLLSCLQVSSRRQSTALGKIAELSESGLGGFSNDYENKLESRGDTTSQPRHLLQEVKPTWISFWCSDTPGGPFGSWEVSVNGEKYLR